LEGRFANQGPEVVAGGSGIVWGRTRTEEAIIEEITSISVIEPPQQTQIMQCADENIIRVASTESIRRATDKYKPQQHEQSTGPEEDDEI
jgi:hypothetical protein